MSGVRHSAVDSMVHRAVLELKAYGQIYPALEANDGGGVGFVERKTERSAKGGPIGLSYSLTKTGQEELRTWLELPPVQEVPRNELLLKLFLERMLRRR